MNATFLAKQEQVLESHALLLVTPLRRDGHIVDVVAAAGGLHSRVCGRVLEGAAVAPAVPLVPLHNTKAWNGQ